MKIYMNYDYESLKFKGFYIDDIHGENIPTPNIEINNDLWKYLQNLTEDFKLKENFESKEIYTLEDICIIQTIPFVSEYPKPTRIDLLEQENADLLLDSALKDERIEQLENDLSDLMLEIATIGGN